MDSYESDVDSCEKVSGGSFYESVTNYYGVYSNEPQPIDGGNDMFTDERYYSLNCNNSDSRNDMDSIQQPSSSYQQFIPTYYQQGQVDKFGEMDHHLQSIGDDVFYTDQITNSTTGQPFVRVVKRRNTANKKERRRTQSINSAFSYLRERIPNVPVDTKLSKIKTLRLATSYISYLINVLEGEQDPSGGFRAELIPSSRKINAERRAKGEQGYSITELPSVPKGHKKNKGRTGWPQYVWDSGLKNGE